MRMGQRLCEVLSSKFKLREACYLLLPALIAVGLSAEVSPPASDLPSNQQVIAFLTESIDWYRHRALERQIATEPVDLVFLEDNRPVAAQIVQLSFDFARADASVAATSPAGDQKGSTAIATGSSPDLAQFVQLENDAELGRRQATEEIEAIKKKLPTASDDERRKLQAELDATQSRLDVLQAGSATLHQLVEWLRAFAGRETGGLASTIDDLARTVPEVTSPTAVALQPQNSPSSSLPKPPDSGILTLSSEVSALGRKLSVLDDEIRRTDKLKQSSDDLRSPLLACINKRLPAVAENYLRASDLGELLQQKARLDELAVLVKALSPAIVALDKQNVLLATYTSHLKSWRAAVITEDKKAWKALISRLVGAAVLIGALLMIGALVRRATQRHMQETERRHIILVIQRVVLWFTIVVVAIFAFASELTSSATFFGLLALLADTLSLRHSAHPHRLAHGFPWRFEDARPQGHADRPCRRGPARVFRVQDAAAVGLHGRIGRSGLGVVADHDRHHSGYLQLQPGAVHQEHGHHQDHARRHHHRQAHPGPDPGLGIWRLPGVRGRLRYRRRHPRQYPRRPRLRTAVRRPDLPDRQHGPQRLRGHRHPGPDAGPDHEPGREDPELPGRLAADPIHRDHPHPPGGAHHQELQGDQRGRGHIPGVRGGLRHPRASVRQVLWRRASRPGWQHLQHGGDHPHRQGLLQGAARRVRR